MLGENQIPVMPMLHILSTHGFLLSFDLLNFQPTRVDICSPPQNLGDQSGLQWFKQAAIENKTPPNAAQYTPPNQSFTNIAKTPSSADFQQLNNLTFAIPETGATSTPAKPPPMQAKPSFGLSNIGNQQPKPTMTGLFGSTGTTGFGASPFNLGGTKEQAKPFIAQSTVAAAAPPPNIAQNTVANTAKPPSEASQPFLTVQPTYKPSPQPIK